MASKVIGGRAVAFEEGTGGAGGGDVVPGPSAVRMMRSKSHMAHLSEKEEAAGFRSWLEAWPTISAQFEDFTTKLKRRQLSSQIQIAIQTGTILRNMVGTCKINTVGETLDRVRQMGKQLIAAQPLEFVVGNMVRRVLYTIREEAFTAKAKKRLGFAGTSLQTILDKESTTDRDAAFKPIRNIVLEGISEAIDELDNMSVPIAEQALEHIHANEVILTFGKSTTVEEFLKAAAKRRKFEVIVVETAPTFVGHDTALVYAKAGIPTTVINDSAVFAIMARVNKVIIGAQAVMANGGLISHSGAHLLALAAQYHSVPFVCVTGLLKLCPLYPHDQDTFNDLLSPTAVLSFEEADVMDAVEVLNPEFDYVPPKLVDLFVTNAYGVQPSYVYRLLAEYYSPEDYVL
mmetsp:Transcript_22575/g.78990  ORF Transcript_22575/g.78990 Transcript_22575/m.78990 type:complete len:402 (-) Transcript_22575:119-1324(-)